MSQPACMPFISPSQSGTDPAGCVAPQGLPNPTGNASDGCQPSPSGVCTSGWVGSNPVPGPGTQYFAQTETGCCLRGDTLLNTPLGTIRADQVVVGTQLSSVNPQTWITITEIVSGVSSFNRPYLTLTIGTETINCTAEHGFFTGINQSITAGELLVGSTVIDSSANSHTVSAIGYVGADVVYCIKTQSGFNMNPATSSKIQTWKTQ